MVLITEKLKSYSRIEGMLTQRSSALLLLLIPWICLSEVLLACADMGVCARGPGLQIPPGQSGMELDA